MGRRGAGGARRVARRGLALVLAAGAVLAAAPAGLAAPASPGAPPLDDARTRAAALAGSVAELRVQAEQATESYDRISANLAGVVASRVVARQRADAARATAVAATQLASRRARALYQSGGPLSLYAGVLGAGDVGAVAEGLQAARRMAADTRALDATAAAAVSSADATVAAVRQQSAEQTALETAAADAATRVTALLESQGALLRTADAEVQQLAAEEQARAEAAAQAAFAARLAAARAQAAQQRALLAAVPAAAPATPGWPPPGAGTRSDGAAGPLLSRAAQAMAALTATHPPYVWGGTGPTGYDCSGLTGAAYAAAGLILPRTAAQQYLAGPHPALADLAPGDLLFWATNPADPATIHHVGMYAGNGLMWSTNHTGDVARLQAVWGNEFAGATRPDPALAPTVPGPVWRAGG